MKSQHYVYVVGVEGLFVKFGCAKDVAKRLPVIQAGCPIELFVLSFAKVSNEHTAKELEQLIHADMARYTLRGEWFQYVPEAIKIIDALRSANSSNKVARLRDYLKRRVEEIEEQQSVSGFAEAIPYIATSGAVKLAQFRKEDKYRRRRA